MAIVFEKQLSLNDLLFSYNNNTVTFKQSSTTLIPTKATVFFNNMQFTLFPDPQKKFYFNFKYAVSTMLNGTNNFADVISLDLVTPIVNDFQSEVIADGGTFEAFDCLVAQITELGVDPIIDYTDTIFKNFNVTYKIFYSNNSEDTQVVNYNFLSAVVNPQNYKQLYPDFPYAVDTQMFLKPIPYLKYWSGYPFDVTFYNGHLSDLVVGTITNIGQTFSLRNLIWEASTTTPIDGSFSNGTPSFNGAVGDDVTFYYNRPTDNDILSSIRENDIISMNNNVIGTWVYSVNSVLKTGDIYAINLEIVTIGALASPGNGSTISNSITLANGLINTERYTNENRINRVVISNGNEFINLERGYNNFVINNVSIQIENITDVCSGHYLKWLNSFGGWNYWLFYKGNDTLTTKDLGTIYNDYEDVVDTISPYVAIGKTSENNIAVRQELITPNEMLILNDLLDSPKVYLFTGTPSEVAQPNDWLEVTIKAGSFRVSNSKEKMNNLNLTIEIPTNTTKIL
jgi:hypothetical protein